MIRTVNVEEITKNIKEMCIEANHYLSPDMDAAMKRAKEEEKAPETGKKKNVTGIMTLVLIAAIGGIGGFMYMKSNKGKKKTDAPDPDADYFDSEDDEDYLADMDIGEESVSDQDTDEDISMEEDIQMDEADEK